KFRHRNIHQDNVRQLRSHQLQRLSSRATFGDDLDIRNLLEQRANTSAHENVIVRQQHTSRIHLLLLRPSRSDESVKGRDTSTVVPFFGDEMIFARASTRAARSFIPISPSPAVCVWADSASKPLPLSRTCNRKFPFSRPRSTSTCVAFA